MRLKNWLLGDETATAAAPGASAGLLVLRVVAMLLLIGLHGSGKVLPGEGLIGYVGSMGFPAPVLFAWIAMFSEVIVAALVLIGLLSRPAALFLFLHLVIVVLVAHSGDALGDREVPMLFATIALTLALTGPGRYSVDAMMRDRKAAPELP